MGTDRTTIRLSDERKQLLEDEEWRKAAQTAKEYDEWVRGRKQLADLERRIESIEAGGTGSGRGRARNADGDTLGPEDWQ